MQASWGVGIAGGVIIGAAGALMLVIHGRIAGISGIFGHVLHPDTADRAWRVAFVLGLVAVGAIAAHITPQAITSSPRPLPLVVASGLLVGFGTRMSGGCTSGHGMCGLGRLSRRSFVAVMMFMATGMLTAWAVGGR